MVCLYLQSDKSINFFDKFKKKMLLKLQEMGYFYQQLLK